MITLKKITLEELEEFVFSDFFKKLRNKPISKPRAISYINNPRANKKDYIVFMAFKEEELVGYRTILPDHFFIGSQKKSFGWLSGNWVDLNFRRKGISTLLFNEVLKEWNHRLLFTNFSKASELLYYKTKQFDLLKELKGSKYYLRFCLADILPHKKAIFKFTKVFLYLFDVVFNILFDVRFVFLKSSKTNNLIFKKDEVWNESIYNFTKNDVEDNFFKRGKKEMNWIKNFPWILSTENQKKEFKNYHFSSYAKEFNFNSYSIYNKENVLIGLLLITIKNKHMKIPYIYFNDENVREIANFISSHSIKYNIKTLELYNESLEKELNTILSFLSRKDFTQKYFITKNLKNSVKGLKNIKIQSGDGDSVFT